MSLERFKKLAWRWILLMAVLCSLCALVLLMTGTTEQRPVVLSGFGVTYEFSLWAPLVWDTLSLVAWVALGFFTVHYFLFVSRVKNRTPIIFFSLFLGIYAYQAHIVTDIGMGLLSMFLFLFLVVIFEELLGIAIKDFDPHHEFDSIFIDLIVLAGVAFGVAVTTKLGPMLGIAAGASMFVAYILGALLGYLICFSVKKTRDATAFCKRKGSTLLQWLLVRTTS
jgi:hypothetical protein